MAPATGSGGTRRAESAPVASDGDSTDRLGRRSVLKSVFGVGGSTLAGCFGDGGGDSQTGSAPRSATSGPSPTDTVSPTSGASPTDRTRRRQPDGAVVVEPGGDIQGALSEVAGRGKFGQTPNGVVRLVAGETYEVDETIRMPIASVLECNGAKITPTGDFDVLEAGTLSYVYDPFIDARGVSGWDSTLLKVTTNNGPVTAVNNCIVQNMWLVANQDTGTGLLVEDTNEEGIAWLQLSGLINHTTTGIHLRSEGQGSFVNSAWFEGWSRVNDVALLTEWSEPGAAVNDNRFHLAFQPSDSSWFWDLQGGKRNRVTATCWDAQHIADRTIWRIGDDAGGKNKLIEERSNFTWADNVVENRFGDAPNGAGGNVLFNWQEAMVHRDLKRRVADLEESLSE